MVLGCVDADCRDEGLIFVDPRLLVASERQTRMILRQNLPLADLTTLRKIGTMYPSPSRSGSEFVTQFDRVNSMISGNYPLLLANADWIFNCNTRYLTSAYGQTYNYRYSLRPSIHAADLFLTFLDMKIDWQGKRNLVHVPYARAWQSYLISFIKHGDPNVQRRPETIDWPSSGQEMKIVDLRWEGFVWKTDDQVDEDKCSYWQRADYAPKWNIST